jgi:hypothetical protein
MIDEGDMSLLTYRQTIVETPEPPVPIEPNDQEQKAIEGTSPEDKKVMNS